MTQDPRAARSRASFHDALFDLVARLGFDSLTIVDLCETARISRPTFYKHFDSPDDVARSALRELWRPLLDPYRSGAPVKGQTRLRFSLVVLEHVRLHVPFYKGLLSSGRDTPFVMLRAMLAEMVPADLAAAGPKSPGIARDRVVRFLIGSFLGVLAGWLEDGAEETPRDVDLAYRRLALNGIGAIPAAREQ